MSKILRSFRKSSKGATLVEFALTLPLFILIIMGIVDFGRAFNNYNTISNAAREGARVGVIPANSDASIRQRARQMGVLLNLTDGDIAISSRTPGQRFTVTATHRFYAITPLISAFLPGGYLTLTGSASMRMEY